MNKLNFMVQYGVDDTIMGMKARMYVTAHTSMDVTFVSGSLREDVGGNIFMWEVTNVEVGTTPETIIALCRLQGFDVRLCND